MRSAVFQRAGQPLAIVERDMPQPGPLQALIRVRRCGICGSDLHMTSGSAFDMAAGTVPGHEFAGEVVALGPGRVLLAVGDRVTALPLAACGECEACRADSPLHCQAVRQMQGGFGEYMLIDQRYAVRLPDSLSFADGALVEPLASALRGVRRLPLTSQSRVAVLGAGAIGAAAVFWARRLGAGRIVAVARSTRNAALVVQMGADTFEAAGEGLAQRLADRLGGAPDVVIEATGAVGTIQQAIELVRVGGTVLSLGGCVAPEPILPVVAMYKEVEVKFSVAWGVEDFRQAVAVLAEGAAGVVARAMIGDTIALDALPQRFEAMRSGSHPPRVMVDPSL